MPELNYAYFYVILTFEFTPEVSISIIITMPSVMEKYSCNLFLFICFSLTVWRFDDELTHDSMHGLFNTSNDDDDVAILDLLLLMSSFNHLNHSLV